MGNFDWIAHHDFGRWPEFNQYHQSWYLKVNLPGTRAAFHLLDLNFN